MLSFKPLFLFSPCIFLSVKAQWTIGQEVKTTSGLLKGHASPLYPEVSEYLGVRFGETTAGKNRFMPPKRYYGTDKFEAANWVSDIQLL
jgi:carboxylesterase type B